MKSLSHKLQVFNKSDLEKALIKASWNDEFGVSKTKHVLKCTEILAGKSSIDNYAILMNYIKHVSLKKWVYSAKILTITQKCVSQGTTLDLCDYIHHDENELKKLRQDLLKNVVKPPPHQDQFQYLTSQLLYYYFKYIMKYARHARVFIKKKKTTLFDQAIFMEMAQEDYEDEEEELDEREVEERRVAVILTELGDMEIVVKVIATIVYIFEKILQYLLVPKYSDKYVFLKTLTVSLYEDLQKLYMRCRLFCESNVNEIFKLGENTPAVERLYRFYCEVVKLTKNIQKVDFVLNYCRPYKSTILKTEYLIVNAEQNKNIEMFANNVLKNRSNPKPTDKSQLGNTKQGMNDVNINSKMKDAKTSKFNQGQTNSEESKQVSYTTSSKLKANQSQQKYNSQNDFQAENDTYPDSIDLDSGHQNQRQKNMNTQQADLRQATGLKNPTKNNNFFCVESSQTNQKFQNQKKLYGKDEDRDDEEEDEIEEEKQTDNVKQLAKNNAKTLYYNNDMEDIYEEDEASHIKSSDQCMPSGFKQRNSTEQFADFSAKKNGFMGQNIDTQVKRFPNNNQTSIDFVMQRKDSTSSTIAQKSEVAAFLDEDKLIDTQNILSPVKAIQNASNNLKAPNNSNSADKFLQSVNERLNKEIQSNIHQTNSGSNNNHTYRKSSSSNMHEKNVKNQEQQSQECQLRSSIDENQYYFKTAQEIALQGKQDSKRKREDVKQNKNDGQFKMNLEQKIQQKRSTESIFRSGSFRNSNQNSISSSSSPESIKETSKSNTKMSGSVNRITPIMKNTNSHLSAKNSCELDDFNFNSNPNLFSHRKRDSLKTSKLGINSPPFQNSPNNTNTLLSYSPAKNSFYESKIPLQATYFSNNNKILTKQNMNYHDEDEFLSKIPKLNSEEVKNSKNSQRDSEKVITIEQICNTASQHSTENRATQQKKSEFKGEFSIEQLINNQKENGQGIKQRAEVQPQYFKSARGNDNIQRFKTEEEHPNKVGINELFPPATAVFSSTSKSSLKRFNFVNPASRKKARSINPARNMNQARAVNVDNYYMSDNESVNEQKEEEEEFAEIKYSQTTKNKDTKVNLGIIKNFLNKNDENETFNNAFVDEKTKVKENHRSNKSKTQFHCEEIFTRDEEIQGKKQISVNSNNNLANMENERLDCKVEKIGFEQLNTFGDFELFSNLNAQNIMSESQEKDKDFKNYQKLNHQKISKDTQEQNNKAKEDAVDSYNDRVKNNTYEESKSPSQNINIDHKILQDFDSVQNSISHPPSQSKLESLTETNIKNNSKESNEKDNKLTTNDQSQFHSILEIVKSSTKYSSTLKSPFRPNVSSQNIQNESKSNLNSIHKSAPREDNSVNQKMDNLKRDHLSPTSNSDRYSKNVFFGNVPPTNHRVQTGSQNNEIKINYNENQSATSSDGQFIKSKFILQTQEAELNKDDKDENEKEIEKMIADVFGSSNKDVQINDILQKEENDFGLKAIHISQKESDLNEGENGRTFESSRKKSVRRFSKNSSSNNFQNGQSIGSQRKLEELEEQVSQQVNDNQIQKLLNEQMPHQQSGELLDDNVLSKQTSQSLSKNMGYSGSNNFNNNSLKYSAKQGMTESFNYSTAASSLKQTNNPIQNNMSDLTTKNSYRNTTQNLANSNAYRNYIFKKTITIQSNESSQMQETQRKGSTNFEEIGVNANSNILIGSQQDVLTLAKQVTNQSIVMTNQEIESSPSSNQIVQPIDNTPTSMKQITIDKQTKERIGTRNLNNTVKRRISLKKSEQSSSILSYSNLQISTATNNKEPVTLFTASPSGFKGKVETKPEKSNSHHIIMSKIPQFQNISNLNALQAATAALNSVSLNNIAGNSSSQSLSQQQQQTQSKQSIPNLVHSNYYNQNTQIQANIATNQNLLNSINSLNRPQSNTINNTPLNSNSKVQVVNSHQGSFVSPHKTNHQTLIKERAITAGSASSNPQNPPNSKFFGNSQQNIINNNSGQHQNIDQQGIHCTSEESQNLRNSYGNVERNLKSSNLYNSQPAQQGRITNVYQLNGNYQNQINSQSNLFLRGGKLNYDRLFPITPNSNITSQTNSNNITNNNFSNNGSINQNSMYNRIIKQMPVSESIEDYVADQGMTKQPSNNKFSTPSSNTNLNHRDEFQMKNSFKQSKLNDNNFQTKQVSSHLFQTNKPINIQ